MSKLRNAVEKGGHVHTARLFSEAPGAGEVNYREQWRAIMRGLLPPRGPTC